MSSGSSVSRALSAAFKCSNLRRIEPSAVCYKRNPDRGTPPPISRRRYSTSVRTIVQSPYSDVVVPECSLPEYTWEKCDRWADRPAVECGITGRSLTYSEIREMSVGFASGLMKLGLKPREVLTIVLPNMPEYPAIVLGALQADLIVSTVSPVYTEDEISIQIKDSECRCIVTNSQILPRVLAVGSRLERPPKIVCLDGAGDPRVVQFRELVDAGKVSPEPEIRISPEDTAMLPYSSGTTGLPKGVCLTHKSLAVNIQQTGNPEISHIQETTKDHQDIIPAVLPFFHIYGLCVVMFQALRKGAKLITLPKFDPEKFLKILEDNKEIALHVAPPVILFLGSHPSVKPVHLDHIRTAVTGGAPCGSADIKRVQEKRNFPIVQAYGMTEASPVVTFPTIDCTDTSTIGPPVSNTLGKIVDLSTNNDLRAGEVGELCFKGPQIMKGYHKRPDATAETIDNDGWLHTGDIGYFNNKGNFYVVDRVKELIKVKGFQVAPAELEAVLREHPHISDAGVTSIASTRTGEKPVAFVVLKQDVSQLDPEKIKEFVSKKVAPYKQLADVFVIDKIPKTLAGKILRRELKQIVHEMTNK